MKVRLDCHEAGFHIAEPADDLIGVGVTLDKMCCDMGGENGKEGDAEEHEQDGHESPLAADRDLIAVPDCGGGHHSPPEGVTDRLDRSTVSVVLGCEYDQRTSDDDGDGEHREPGDSRTTEDRAEGGEFADCTKGGTAAASMSSLCAAM